MSPLIGGTVRTFHRSWKQLVPTDIVYKVLALVLLTPLVGGLFRLVVAISGTAVLSDVDILFFFLGPVGWICSSSVGALWLGIVALEQASLMGIICAKTADKNLGQAGAIRFAVANAWRVIRVTARIVASTLLTATPLLGALRRSISHCSPTTTSTLEAGLRRSSRTSDFPCWPRCLTRATGKSA